MAAASRDRIVAAWPSPERPLRRRRHVVDDRRRAAAGCRRSRVADVQSSGNDASRRDAALQTGDQFLLRQRAGVEELLHQRIVGFRDHLDQRLARRLRRRLDVGRHRALGGLAAPSPANVHAFIADQVDDAAERLLLADRQLDRE